jgi:hypothetical protein
VSTRLPRPVAVVGAGVVSAHGADLAGLARAFRGGELSPSASAELHASHPGARSFELTSLPEPRTLAERRGRAMMSRSAVLACAAAGTAIEASGWRDHVEEVGFYLGVGASGGALPQLDAMLGASIVEHEFSLARFGDDGLRACNPLFAFQLMQNFTLCHAAIVHGTQGPNAAYFSRGAGTVTALREAAYAILDGDCSRALAGGSDSAVHAVTWSELVRGGYATRGLVPGEGAALLALSGESERGGTLAFVEHAAVDASDANVGDVDAVVVAPWGDPARDDSRAFSARKWPGRPVFDASRLFGEALAAGPALAWALALDLLREERLRRIAIQSLGVDGAAGLVVLAAGGMA